MPKIERRTFIKRTAAGGIALLGGITRAPHGPNAARAQGTTEATWPNRPVRFIVPLAPGGGLDFVARVVGESVSRAIGQQIVIENRTGAGGTIGIETAIKSPPDGYSVLVTNDNVASAPHILKLGVDYLKELVPVTQVSRFVMRDQRPLRGLVYFRTKAVHVARQQDACGLDRPQRGGLEL